MSYFNIVQVNDVPDAARDALNAASSTSAELYKIKDHWVIRVRDVPSGVASILASHTAPPALLKRNVLHITAAGHPNAGFGPTCDGTDDEAEWNQLFADLAGTDGGKIIASPGDFVVGTAPISSPQDGVVIDGAGPGDRTEVTFGGDPAASFGTGTRIIPSASYTGTLFEAKRPGADRPVQGFTLRDIAFDGKDAAGVSTPLVVFDTWRGRFDNYHVYRSAGVGVRCQGTTDSYKGTDNIHMAFNYSFNAGSNLVVGQRGTDNHFVHGIIRNGDSHGVEMETDTGGCLFTQCHIYDNMAYGIYMVGGSYLRLLGGKIENSRKHGLYVGSGTGNINVVGTNFRKNGRGGADASPSSSNNTYSHIYMQHTGGVGSGRNILGLLNFTADTMDDTADQYRPAYCIVIAGTAVTDTQIWGISYTPTHVQQGLISDSGVRTRLNGLGKFSGDPTGSHWETSGNLVPGEMIEDTAGTTIRLRRWDGSFVALN